MKPTHREQANQHLGREVTHVSRDFTGQSQGSGDEFSETSSTVSARVDDISSVSSSDTGLEQIGQIPDDGVVIRVKDIDVEEDDQFEIDGERYDIMNLKESSGEGNEQYQTVAYCKPERA